MRPTARAIALLNSLGVALIVIALLEAGGLNAPLAFASFATGTAVLVQTDQVERRYR